MGIVCMRCGGVSVSLRMGEFGESQVGVARLKSVLDCREGVKRLAKAGVCFQQRTTGLGDLTQDALGGCNRIPILDAPDNVQSLAYNLTRLLVVPVQAIDLPLPHGAPALQGPEPKLGDLLEGLL